MEKLILPEHKILTVPSGVVSVLGRPVELKETETFTVSLPYPEQMRAELKSVEDFLNNRSAYGKCDECGNPEPAGENTVGQMVIPLAPAPWNNKREICFQCYKQA